MKKLYLLLIMLIIVPIKVHAANNISLSCTPSEVDSGGTINCTIHGNSDTDVQRFTGTVNFTSNNDVSITGVTPSENWNGSASGNTINMSSIMDGGGLNGSFDICQVSIKVNESTTLENIGIRVTNASYKVYGDDNPVQLDSTSETTITINNPNNNIEGIGLASVTVVNGTLQPAFDTNVVGYVIYLNSPETTTFKINATKKTETDSITYTNGDTNSTVDPNNITFTTTGNKSDMLINITVGSGRRKMIYQFIIVKPQKQDVEPAELATLTVGNKNVNLVAGAYEYTVTLDDVSDYEVNATIKDKINYRFSSFFNPPVGLSGETEFTIDIEPLDKSAGLKGVSYIVRVKSSKPRPTETPEDTTSKTTTKNGGGGTTPENPYTGSTSATVVAIILIASFVASLVLYKKNMNGYNN